MFESVLIANRGAIACRILRTLAKQGIGSVTVYADDDADSLHVEQADQSHCLGAGGASDTYLDQERILEIARETGAGAIHPGYGFLSENPGFAERCEQAGMIFIGPTPTQMRAFALKHEARALAESSQVPLIPGSELLLSLDEALESALAIGYPVMLKSTAGGGGIGMQRCKNATELEASFERVRRLGKQSFGDAGVFLEKYIEHARHIEVQVFGDGQGGVIALGERDCSLQRRNQKVVEETPAPNLHEQTRRALADTAIRLMQAVAYRGAGTVEFVLDQDTGAFYFLEVNTRLQVEHGVTEQVWGVDLVAWQIDLARGTLAPLGELPRNSEPQGHAIQARIYAEDPALEFQPAAGQLTHVQWPQADGSALRIEHWLVPGVTVSAYFDPMLAKLITHAADRETALHILRDALDASELYGIETNRDWLRQLLDDEVVCAGEAFTRYLEQFSYQPARIEVISAGTQSTIQDYPGRQGYWDVGIPPSGPFDDLSFRIGNRMLGNAVDAAGLELTLAGPTLRFTSATTILLTGAPMQATMDGADVPFGQPVSVHKGATLQLGALLDAGTRSYLLIRGGLACPKYLGSRSTFTLGKFGGHAGRVLRTGDVLHLNPEVAQPVPLPSAACLPAIGHTWELRVLCGPHGAPDFFTEADIETFFATDWKVHFNSSRTGIRLIGPKPDWARPDGGEAGLHPSNIHDNAYALGAVDYTGDMPVILGPDGPSLGGFVCPATVIAADRWKLGQLQAGDSLRFMPIDTEAAVQIERDQNAALESLSELQTASSAVQASYPVEKISAGTSGIEVRYRPAGDKYILIEYGPNVLDITLRFRVHALLLWLQQNQLDGMRELTPGIRSLQVHFDSLILPRAELLEHLQRAEQELERNPVTEVASRIVHLPLSWDDPACHEAIGRYEQGVRGDAPWCPDNIDFIRRINGLESTDQVREIVFDASYLVLGLGDVYLGAPVATPVDPRHRLVTTKYNPARTWTAENSVGIGGSYLCVYGMEGPGGYQFVGRTLQMWNRFRRTREFEQPWLLRFFDQIRFFPVSHTELERIRADFPRGRYPLKIEETTFNLAAYQQMLADKAESIAAFQQQRSTAFEEELQRWHRDGVFHLESETDTVQSTEPVEVPHGCVGVESAVTGNVWKLLTEPGETVEIGQTIAIIESMKTEIPVTASLAGRVREIRSTPGTQVAPGDLILILEPAQ